MFYAGKGAPRASFQRNQYIHQVQRFLDFSVSSVGAHAMRPHRWNSLNYLVFSPAKSKFVRLAVAFRRNMWGLIRFSADPRKRS
jgi:hypothetical protein